MPWEDMGKREVLKNILPPTPEVTRTDKEKCKDCEYFAEIKGFGMNSCKKSHRYITKSDNCGFGTEGCPKWCPAAIQSSKGVEQKG